MSSTVEVLLRSALVALLILILPGLGWPDITPFLGYFQQLFGMLYLLNPILNIDLLFALGKVILVLDLILIARALIMAVVQFITTGSFQRLEVKFPGQGGIGGGETGI